MKLNREFAKVIHALDTHSYNIIIKFISVITKYYVHVYTISSFKNRANKINFFISKRIGHCMLGLIIPYSLLFIPNFIKRK